MIYNVDVVLLESEQILDEIVADEIEVVFVSEPVIRAGHHKEVKSLVVLNQRLGKPERVRRVHVVIHVSGYQQQLALQIPGKFDVCRNTALETDVPILVSRLFNPVERLAPPLRVDVVVMIPGSRDRDLVEVRPCKHCRGRHEATSRMSVDADPFQVRERIPLRDLPYDRIVVVKRVVA